MLRLSASAPSSFGVIQMNEKARLVIKSAESGEPISYQCSSCGQRFVLPEDRSPKEAVAELWGAFKDHIREEHPEQAELEV